MSKVSQLLCLLFIVGYSSTHAQTLYSHINGIAWKETLPVNNIMDPGEATIRGILVTLKDAATDEIISSTVTNAAGNTLWTITMARVLIIFNMIIRLPVIL